jgi:zinc D-Ala-D-Ala carboxypeptidase
MLKTIAANKIAKLNKSTVALASVALLAGVFGVHAAAANHADEAVAMPPVQSVVVADRDDAASRGAVRSVAVQMPAAVLADQAAAAKAEAPALDHFRVENEGVENGTLNEADLCKLSWTADSIVRCDAANAMEHMNAAFKAEFGSDFDLNASYRDYAKQVRVRDQLGSVAAIPGTSNHGYGVAVDLGSNIPSGDSPEYEWMTEHAAEFGFVNPDWAKTIKIEPWHWEFVGFDN